MLGFSLAIHVADEALTGFLPVYNSIIEGTRKEYTWLPLPTFTFRAWLSGLIVGVLLIFALTPLAFRGDRILRPVSYILGVMMIGNGSLHIGASFLWGEAAPGVYSAPLLIISSLLLLAALFRSR